MDSGKLEDDIYNKHIYIYIIIVNLIICILFPSLFFKTGILSVISLGCPGIHLVDQAACQGLGLKA